MKPYLRRLARWSTTLAAAVVMLVSVLLPGGLAQAATLAVDVTVNQHQSSVGSTISSPAFTTHQANELLVAFVMSDGLSTGAQSFSSVTGGGLTWTLRARSNAQPGTAEIWQAVAPDILTNATVTATRASGSWVGSLTVVSFTGADTAINGATSTNSGASGSPSTSLTTTAANSWVWGVGTDWTAAIGRTVGPNQTLVDQYLAPVGDTYWVQRQNATTPAAGTLVTINDTAPTTDKFDIAAIEIIPAGGTGGVQPPTAPTNLSANVVNAGQVDLIWTASTSSIGIDRYNIARGGANIGTSTTTGYSDTTTVGGNTYTYTVTAIDTQGNLSPPSNTATATTPATGSDQIGQTGPIMQWPNVAIHSALTPTGKILTFQGDFSQGGQQYLWDPATSIQKQIPNAAADLFCAGQAVLADGRVAVIGGTSTSGGLGVPNLTAFDWNTEQWQDLAPMHYPRWYATGTTLSDGKVLVTSGDNQNEGDIVGIPEIYTPNTNTWADLTAANHVMPIYPFIYQLPDGRVLHAGGSEVPTPTEVLDLNTNKWSTVDGRIIDGASIVNYASGKFMKAGSAADSGNSGPATNTAFTLDMNQPSPAWQPTSSMAYPRAFVNLTPLPDGTVLASGGGTEKSGYNDANGVLPMEIWSPATGQWKTVSSLTEPRLYHSVATLLPDGRVFISGGGSDAGVPDHKTAQLYSPPYLFKGTRPAITSAPGTVQYNESTFVQTPDAPNITSVSLIRTGSVTHSFDQNSRALSLSFTQTQGGLNVQMPANGNLAPPGYYMMSIVNSQGVPSVSSLVRIPAPYEDAQPPSAVTDLAANATGSNQVQLSWTASTDNQGVVGYNTFRDGVRIGSAATTSFTDNTVIPNTTYNYMVTAYDSSGNTSPPSNTAMVTTPPDTVPPVISNVVATPKATTATVTWTTDKPADSQIFYGPTSSYGLSTAYDPTLRTSHLQSISGLTPSTTYHFQVRSASVSAVLGTSSDLTFTMGRGKK